MSLLSRLDRCYSNISELEAAGVYWTVATTGSLHSDDRPSDHLPITLRVTRKPGRAARRPRLSQELVNTTEYQECLTRLATGIEVIGDVGERYSVIVEVAHRAARQARKQLFRPGLSQPVLLAEAALRVYFACEARQVQGGVAHG